MIALPRPLPIETQADADELAPETVSAVCNWLLELIDHADDQDQADQADQHGGHEG